MVAVEVAVNVLAKETWMHRSEKQITLDIERFHLGANYNRVLQAYKLASNFIADQWAISVQAAM